VKRWFALAVGVTVLVCGLTALAQSPAAPAAPADVRLDEARRHFELGIAHFDREEWQAALVEFLESRALSPTKTNTKNAAICLRKVGRFDEALEMFRALVRDFPDLPPAERQVAEREIAELQASVGSIELREVQPGARITIDGVERGTTPLGSPLRVAAGAHVVRVTRDGFLPFETRVDAPGNRVTVVSATLVAVTRAGRLRIVERAERPSEIVIDGAVVGRTPWEGALAPGTYSVWLRGAESLGTSPAPVEVTLDRLNVLVLSLERLSATLEVSATPETAQITVDRARVGRGRFEGRYAPGRHEVTVSADGYEPLSQSVELSAGRREMMDAELEPLARGKPSLLLELGVGLPLTLLWGGDLAKGCTGTCSAAFRPGIEGLFHGQYRLPSGFGFGVQAGYLRVRTAFEDRPDTLTPVGRGPAEGVADDELRISGLVVGAEAEYAIGARFRLAGRLSFGALIGAVTDDRTGSFVGPSGDRYDIDARQTPSASYFYVGPEARAGYALDEHFEASVGVKLLVLAALGTPAWRESGTLRVSESEVGNMPDAELTGGAVLALVPELGLRYFF
jgi:hypothetical protein